MSRIFFAALLVALAPLALLASPDLIIPITGTVPGAEGSQWRGGLTLHNASLTPASIRLELYGNAGLLAAADMTLPARTTRSMENLVGEAFGLGNAAGALVIDVDDDHVGKVAASSRIINHTPGGEFGQDVAVVRSAEMLRSGATAVIAGPPSVASARFNFGIWAAEPTSVTWRLLRADGTVAGEIVKTYEAGTHEQYNQGVEGLFGETPADDDVIHARVVSGEAVAYGSIVASSTGDPTFVPGFAVRENFAIEFAGVDLDENGSVDLPDADHDGRLDVPVTLFAGYLPNYFRVVATAPEGATIEYTVVEGPRDTALIDDRGTVLSYPGIEYKGRDSFILIRASDGFATADFVIPVVIR